MSTLTLVSHALCPYVQRVAIVLLEKGVPFTRVDVDLNDKPAWFVACSPLGKTPVLLDGDEAIFESAVICEYLDEVHAPRLHAQDPLRRARTRAWMEYASSVLGAIAALYNAPDDAALDKAELTLRQRLAVLEQAVPEAGWFDGAGFGLVDAAFAPAFRYFPLLARGLDRPLLEDTPHTRRWALDLAARPSVQAAATPRYAELLERFLLARPSALAGRLAAAAA